jgi:SMC interacting uncharacterized protein involved in chromosome segregation
MWQKLIEFGKQLLTLKGQVEKNTRDIQDLRADLDDLVSQVIELKYAVKYNFQIEVSEREKLLLQIENMLLKQNRRGHLPLPDAASGELPGE